MLCPYCGAELESGTLRSRGGNYFLPEGVSPCKISFYTEKFIRKANAVALPPSPYDVSAQPEWPAAHCCRSCKKIIIDYE